MCSPEGHVSEAGLPCGHVGCGRVLGLGDLPSEGVKGTLVGPLCSPERALVSEPTL